MYFGVKIQKKVTLAEFFLKVVNKNIIYYK